MMFNRKATILMSICGTAAALGMAAATTLATSVPTHGIVAVDEDAVLEGKISGVNDEDNSFKLNTGDTEITLYLTERTKYTLNGEESTREAVLKAGVAAKVMHRSLVATEVHAKTEK